MAILTKTEKAGENSSEFSTDPPYGGESSPK